MDGYIIGSNGGANFESKEVSGFTIEVKKHVVLTDKLMLKELIYFGRCRWAAELDQGCHKRDMGHWDRAGDPWP
eukprot:1262346-Ditylum_brightwellii.AAC.3